MHISVFSAVAAAALSLQLCPTLCDPMGCSLPVSSVHGILWTRVLEWVAMPSSRGSSQPRDWIWVSCIAGRFFTAESPGKPMISSSAAATAAKSPQSCPTLCDPKEGSPLGSSVPGILQARILERVAISFSNAWKWKVKVKLLSCAQLLATPWTGAYQAPPSMGFSRQEYWSRVPLPSTLCQFATSESFNSYLATAYEGAYQFHLNYQWQPTPVFLPGKSYGWRSLVGCRPWGREESDMTERLHFHFSLSCIGEGHGNSLQCSCLENPRDGGAWWAASMGSHRVGHDWSDLAAATATTNVVTFIALSRQVGEI